MGARCLFCGGEYTDYADHSRYACDGRQARIEAASHRVPAFDGETYDHDRDHSRLHAQLRRVFAALQDRAWHTLRDLSQQTGDPEASISARVRDLRKEKFGAYAVERRYVERGVFEYRLLTPVGIEA